MDKDYVTGQTTLIVQVNSTYFSLCQRENFTLKPLQFGESRQ